MFSLVGYRSARSKDRSKTAGLVALCIGGQLLAMAHLAVVVHEICPEHGDLTHGGAHEGTVAVAPQSVAIETDDAAGALRSRDADDADAHCWVATERRALLGCDPGPAIELPPAREPALLDTVATPSSRALYRRAPKTSPPQPA